MVKRALEDTIDDLGLSDRLRPDGKLFLMINFHQMVVYPLLKQRENADPAEFKDILRNLDEIVRRDMSLILRAASDDAQQEISGRAVLAAAHATYDDSEIHSYAAW